MFKNQIKSLLAHRVCASVARQRKRPVLPLNGDSITCIREGPQQGLQTQVQPLLMRPDSSYCHRVHAASYGFV